MKSRPRIIIAFIVGLLFATGLAFSGMTQPQKIIGFLNLAGKWDPTLIFVMIGALSVHFWSYRWIKNQPHPIFDDRWHYPTNKEITSPLIIGSALFGIGWGVSGFCPGPAIVSLGSGSISALFLVLSMTAGMYFYDRYMH